MRQLELPGRLASGTYVYGLHQMTIEQINNSTGTVLYLYHDQQGSTRLVTGSTGTVSGKCTYSAYGTPTCEGSATTPLGYDGQYTNTDTGLIYMRARAYDPTTAQFLSVDPLVELTGAPYTYTGGDPLNYADPTGLIFGIPDTPSFTKVVKVFSEVAGGVAAVASTVAAGCAVVAAPTGVGEVVCGAVGGVAVGAGVVATAGDAYLAGVSAQGPGPVIFDTIGLVTGVGGDAFEGLIGDEDLGAYAKAGSSLVSGAAFSEPFGEEAAEARADESSSCG